VRLRRARAGASGESQGACSTPLLAWSGDYHAHGPRRHRRSGVAIWEELKDRSSSAGVRTWRARAGARGAGRATRDLARVRHLQRRGVRDCGAARRPGSARRARRLESCAERFKTRDVARWREKRSLYDVAAQAPVGPPELPVLRTRDVGAVRRGRPLAVG
jgi:hypothetical protein